MLLVVALGRGRDALIVMVNLPLALIGGVAGTWIATNIPGLAGMLSTASGGGAYVGQGVTGLVAGGILTAIVGAIKNATMK